MLNRFGLHIMHLSLLGLDHLITRHLIAGSSLVLGGIAM